MNLYAGFNSYISKIDLITHKITQTKTDIKSSYFSTFDFDHTKQIYIAGTFSGRIYINDIRNDLPVYCISDKHLKGVNKVEFIEGKNNFLTSGRKDNEVLYWDLRNLYKPLFKFGCNYNTNQRVGFARNDNCLFVPGSVGTVIGYNMNSRQVDSYFYIDESKEAISGLCMLNGVLVTATGTRHYPLEGNNSKDDSDNSDKDFYKNSSFRLWNIGGEIA